MLASFTPLLMYAANQHRGEGKATTKGRRPRRSVVELVDEPTGGGRELAGVSGVILRETGRRLNVGKWSRWLRRCGLGRRDGGTRGRNSGCAYVCRRMAPCSGGRGCCSGSRRAGTEGIGLEEQCVETSLQ